MRLRPSACQGVGEGEMDVGTMMCACGAARVALRGLSVMLGGGEGWRRWQRRAVFGPRALVSSHPRVAVACASPSVVCACAPQVCVSEWQRMVPLTPKTQKLGEIVAFYPNGAAHHHVYAVLIRAQNLRLARLGEEHHRVRCVILSRRTVRLLVCSK